MLDGTESGMGLYPDRKSRSFSITFYPITAETLLPETQWTRTTFSSVKYIEKGFLCQAENTWY